MGNRFITQAISGTKLVKEASDVSNNSRERVAYLAPLESSLRFVT